MSKKRNKNQRKKQVKTRSRKTPVESSPSSHRATNLESEWADAYQAPEVQTHVAGGGAIGRMKDMMTHGEEGNDASLLHKRRGCGELLLWLAGGSVVFWVIMRLLAAFAET